MLKSFVVNLLPAAILFVASACVPGDDPSGDTGTQTSESGGEQEEDTGQDYCPQLDEPGLEIRLYIQDDAPMGLLVTFVDDTQEVDRCAFEDGYRYQYPYGPMSALIVPLLLEYQPDDGFMVVLWGDPDQLAPNGHTGAVDEIHFIDLTLVPISD